MFLLLNYFICCGFYFIFFLVNVRFQLRLWRILCMLYAFFWVITRRLEFMCRRFGTLCLFLLHRQEDVSRMILLTSTCLWRWNRQSVLKRRHIKSRHQVILLPLIWLYNSFIEFWPSQPTLSIFFYFGQGSSSLVLLSSVYRRQVITQKKAYNKDVLVF